MTDLIALARESGASIWTCKIGETGAALPPGADAPMRRAVELAYMALNGGEPPSFIFSGWGGKLTEGERAVVENRMPSEEHYQQWLAARASDEPTQAMIYKGGNEINAHVVQALAQEELHPDDLALRIYKAMRSASLPPAHQAGGEGWISVDERLPELGVEVLVYKPASKWGKVQFDTWDMQHEAPVSFSSQTIPTGFGWNDTDDFYDITHWMPAPLPPAPSALAAKGVGPTSASPGAEPS